MTTSSDQNPNETSAIQTPVDPAQALKDAAQNMGMEEAADMGLISEPVQDIPKGTPAPAPAPDFFGE
jgi:hypothetical protein